MGQLASPKVEGDAQVLKLANIAIPAEESGALQAAQK